MQYHFHNVSARDLLVSGEPKWNGWHQVPTIYYVNFFFKLFLFVLVWFWVFLVCFCFVSPAIEIFRCSLIALVNPCTQTMHQYFCLLRQSKFFWVGFFKFKIYLEIAVASASAHRVGGKKNQVWTVLKIYV